MRDITVSCARATNKARRRQMSDAIHIDLRSFELPELMVAILHAIDGG